MLEAEVLISGFIGEEHAVVEGILAAQVVAEHDVRQFMRKRHCQAGLIRQDVHQPAADHDGIAHAEGLKRRGQQHARPDRARQVDVVGDFNVVDDSLQNLVDVAVWSQ